MTKKMIFAGFGGQGVLLMGYLTALTAMRSGKNVTYLPAYGAEVRGGTANCTVVVSDEEIASPVSSSPDYVIVMNNPSLVRFANMVAPGGVLLTNSSLVHGKVKRDDVTLVPVPINELAHELGEDRSANVIMVGALAEATGVMDIEELKEALAETGLGKKPKVLELNRRALEVGAKHARQALGKEKSA
jgi:2-oxoglutarate ferredoxin oxidoreductase subunit gamma